MAKLTRAVQKVFADSAGGTEIEQIGSLRAGAPNFTTDPVVLQALAGYGLGLKGIVEVTKNIPALEDINALYFLLTRQVAYAFQEGIAEYDAATTYFLNSIVKKTATNDLYVSLTDTNVGNALTDTTNWADYYPGLMGNQVLRNNVQLTSADFPNATTLYGWNMDSTTDTAATGDYAGTPFGTTKALTIMAQKLTAANDVLGNSKYNTIATGGYLQSTDAVFNVENTADTDDFMVGGWVYIPDVTPAGVVALFSNTGDSNNGWYVLLNTSGALYSNIPGAGGDTVTSSYTLPSAGYYHVVMAREAGVGQKLYVKGNLVATGANATIGTTQSKFQLGGYNGTNGLPEAGTRYDECFFKKGVLPTNLDDVVKGIYARSAKKFAVKDANTNVFIPELNVSSGVYTPTVANYTNCTTFTTYASSWSRVGNVITVGFKADIDPTSTGDSGIYISYPITCVSTPICQGNASGFSYTQSGHIVATDNTKCLLHFTTANTGTDLWSGTFQYVLN